MKRLVLPGPPLLLLALCCACLGALATYAWCGDAPPLPPYLGDGDRNFDAVMDEKDLLVFIRDWRRFASTGKLTPDSDFNGNKRIDQADAVFIIGEFLRLYDVYHPTTTAALQRGQAAPLPENSTASLVAPRAGPAAPTARAHSAAAVVAPATGPSPAGP